MYYSKDFKLMTSIPTVVHQIMHRKVIMYKMVASDSFQNRLMLDEKAWNAIANQELPIDPLLHLPTSTFKNGLLKKPLM